MKDPIRPCVQEKCPNKKQRTQGLIYGTISRCEQNYHDLFLGKKGKRVIDRY